MQPACPDHPEYVPGYEAPFTNCAACLTAWTEAATPAMLNAIEAITNRDVKVNAA